MAKKSDGIRLEKTPRGARLLVAGQPFIMLGGELHNSNGSTAEAQENAFARLAAVHANTAIVPITWELTEPAEGKFDFSLVDAMVKGARRHKLKLVLLWFGTWKNGESAYVPGWVKTDTRRFFRAQGEPGRNSRTISPLCSSAMVADARAFARLMGHIRKIDAGAGQHTVLMMQVQNETGMLGAARDFSPQANAAFEKPVPRDLITYLKANRDTLLPEVAEPWRAAGEKTSGAWADVFGELAAEAFQAWHIGRFVNHIAAAGKAVHPIPMYANAWLAVDGQKPGQYPSGGPVSRVMDLWRAAAPAIDLLAPDIYAKEFKQVCASYTRAGNPLLIPEASISAGSSNAFWAIAEHDAVCFAPFGIDGVPNIAGFADAYAKIEHDWAALDQTYTLLGQLMPLLVKYQHTGRMRGILQETEAGQTMDLGRYRLEVKFSNHEATKPGRGLVIALTDDEYLVAGQGFAMYFRPTAGDPPNVDVLQQDEGRIEHGQFIPARRLNGDDTHDRGIHLEMGMGVRRVKVYGWQ